MRIIRLFHILLIIARKRLDRLLPPDIEVAPVFRFVLILLRLFPAPGAPASVSLRLTFEELGPIFIKFGQILSTRRDLFSEETANELQKLQDQVPPFPSNEARAIVETSLAETIDQVFARFDDIPLASASVAQVHTAQLRSGEEVVVKIIRPGIEPLIQRDLKVMYMLAHLLQKVWADGKRLHPIEIVEDYQKTIINELDLLLEASNAARLKSNWHNSARLYVPAIYWDYSRKDVMVMERIYGLTASSVTAMREKKVNMKKLAYLGVEIFFTQVFEDNFFHADMHPGNVFIDISDPENPTYIALDCAIIGSLTEDDQTYLAKNLLAFFHQDYHEVARLHVESGWVPPDTDIKEFEAVIRSVCEPVFQKPIKEISFGRVLVSLFQTARRFDMEVQPQLVLLQKTLLNIEGMGRQIYPDLDLWETAAPYMERWMSERMGIAGLFKRLGKSAPAWAEQIPGLPQLAFDALNGLKQLGHNNRQQALILAELKEELANQARSRRWGRVGGFALILALVGTIMPLAGVAAPIEVILGSSVLGGLGIYWIFIRP
ncbi:MAG: ubiquinone biosynthesis regulatory protein kinase UbiB [Pseudomonadales bacterium]